MVCQIRCRIRQKLPLKRAKVWVAVFNNSFARAIKQGMSKQAAEAFAFRNANGVVLKKKPLIDVEAFIKERALVEEHNLLISDKMDLSQTELEDDDDVLVAAGGAVSTEPPSLVWPDGEKLEVIGYGESEDDGAIEVADLTTDVSDTLEGQCDIETHAEKIDRTPYPNTSFTRIPWDGSRARFTLRQVVKAAAYVNANKSDDELTKADARLPHHEPDGTVNMNGVAAAMGALAGARGGINITSSGRQHATAHLALARRDAVKAGAIKTKKLDDMIEAMKDLEVIHDVEIFSTGKHRERKYTENDLDSMTQAFKDMSPELRPPVKIGHAEPGSGKGIGDKSDLPAVGWVSGLRRVGTKLVADFVDVPRVVADLLRRGAYRRTSAEIYHNLKLSNGKRAPIALRAVALLGGTVPEVKTLRDVLALYSGLCII